MKKSMMMALVGLLCVGGITKSYAQDDSAKVAEGPKDTISIDTMEPNKFYEEEAPKQKSSNTTTYAIIGGIVVVGGAAFFLLKKKKK